MRRHGAGDAVHHGFQFVLARQPLFAAADHLFGLPHAIAFADHLVQHGELRFPPVEDEQRARVPLVNGAGVQRLDDFARQVQQAHQVRDRAATAPHAPRHFRLRKAERVHQFAVGLRLFQRVQVRALDVLDQRQRQHLLGVRFLDDHRRGGQAGRLRRAPAPLARDQVIDGGAVVLGASNDQGLQDTVLADRVGQFFQRVGRELVPGLLRVGPDAVDGRLERGPA